MDEAILFYDGGCGLCRRSVRLLVRLDRGGRLRFAPLGGGTFERVVPPAARAALPDSLVLCTADGRLLVRSGAVLAALELAGGPWARLAVVARLAPRRLLDAAYDAVARARGRLFGREPQACPLVPAPLRDRFLP
jgi:predicted DCC family thiol-disulfide oxidoreductase YuxK